MPINEEIIWDDAPTIEAKIASVFGDDAPTALRVAKAESSMNPRAHNPKGGGTGAYGLYQIRGNLHKPALQKAGIIKDVNDLFDVDTNIRAAKYIQSQSGWKPWNESKKKWGKSAVNEEVIWDSEPVNEDVIWDDDKPATPTPQVKTVTPPAAQQDTALLDALEYGDKAKLYPMKEVGKDIVGGVETGLSTVTGLAAMPVAGMGGLLYSNFGNNPEAGEAVVQGVSDMLTYKPQGERGQRQTGILQKPLELLETGTGYVGEKVSDVTGSPLLGAGVKTGLMMAVPAVIGKGLKLTARNVAREIPDLAERKAFIRDVTKEAIETKTPIDEVVKRQVEESARAESPVEPTMKQPTGTPEMRPVEVLGEGKADMPPAQENVVKGQESRLAVRTEADAIEAKLTQDFGELAGYEKMNMKEQAQRAKTVMDADYEQAKRMAMGDEPLPDGLREASIYEGVKLRALAENDVETLRSLAVDSKIPKKLSEYGQAIKAADSGTMFSDPVKAMQEVTEARAEIVKRTGKKPVDVGKLEADLEKRVTALEEHLERKTRAKGEPVQYGSKNIVVNNESYLQAKAELRSKVGRMSSGVDPTVMADLAKIGTYHFEAGARVFKAWSEAMVKDLGSWVKPHLDNLWEQSKKMFTEGTASDRALRTAKTRMKNETARLEERIANLDFTKKERRTTILDVEGMRLKAELERARQAHKAGVEASGVVTKKEATRIVELSKEIERTAPPQGDMGTHPENGAAIAMFKKYVSELKGEDAPVGTQLRNWGSEVKTAWKQDPFRAVYGAAKDTIMQIRNNSVALVASCDMSALLRQGFHTLQTHPVIWARAAKNSFMTFAKTLGGKDTHTATMADIYSRGNYRNGAYDTAKLIPKHEEQFPTSLPGKAPIVGRVFKASESAFNDFMLKTRADIFDLLDKTARENGVVMDKVQIRDNGRLVNSLTARGELGRVGEHGVTKVLLWAPRMLKGNWDVLTAHTGGLGLETSFARKQAALNLVKVIGETATVLMVADALRPGSVEWDTRSSKFGKIRVGETYFDVTGGASSLVVLASRLSTGKYKNIKGRVIPYSSQFGKQSRFDTVETFVTNKMPPSSRAVVDTLKGRNFRGEEMTWARAAYQMGTPITIQQTIDLNDKNSADRVAGVIADALGMNAQQYDKRKRGRSR